jgi:hypothetical protein
MTVPPAHAIKAASELVEAGFEEQAARQAAAGRPRTPVVVRRESIQSEPVIPPNPFRNRPSPPVPQQGGTASADTTDTIKSASAGLPRRAAQYRIQYQCDHCQAVFVQIHDLPEAGKQGRICKKCNKQGATVVSCEKVGD